MFIKVLIIVAICILSITIISYIFAEIICKKMFTRMDSSKSPELLTYDDVKEKYERKEYSFKSGKNTIKAYLYGKESKGLIVYVHGMCPGHTGYLSDITALVDKGYAVFTYDFTATGNSDGKYYKGINQQETDLKKCIDFLSKQDEFKDKDLYLYGHSMGAYAVSVCIDYSERIKKVVSISGFDTPFKEMYTRLTQISNKSTSVLSFYPIFIRQLIRKNTCAHKKISASSKPIFIIHGSNDEMVPYKKTSIIYYKDKIKNKNAKYLLIEDENHNTHNSVIASTNCVHYQKSRMEIFNKVLKDTGNRQKAYEAFVKDIDRFKFNDANLELMDQIDAFYQN